MLIETYLKQPAPIYNLAGQTHRPSNITIRNNVMESSVSPLTQAQSNNLVNRLLAGQDWILVDAGSIAADVWEQTAEPRTRADVEKTLFRRYAAVLYHCCVEGGQTKQDRAWYELRIWLLKSAQRLESRLSTREEIVQETLLTLQKALPATPTAFLAYALQTMRRQHINLNRYETAEKRGSGQIHSLEAMEEDSDKADGRSWEENISASGANWRTIESAVSYQEIRQQLMAFAREYLPTDLQHQVFEAHFLDGLEPAEIARHIGKKAHEIRLVKARIVKKMKTLTPDARRRLFDILGEIDVIE